VGSIDMGTLLRLLPCRSLCTSCWATAGGLVPTPEQIAAPTLVGLAFLLLVPLVLAVLGWAGTACGGPGIFWLSSE
jgi:hypothetical protein